MTNLFAGAVVGLLSGVHAASWGMYKDAPHEGFELRKFLRSILLGAAVGAAAAPALGLDAATARGAAALFGVAYVVERALAEIYKTFLRQEDQSKYTIPMQFAIGGRVVESRALRTVLGLGYFALMLALVGALVAYQHAVGRAPAPIELVVLGAAGGWLSAIGGAWKDAPIEGFQLFKFFRSPAIAALWALVLGNLTADLVTVMLAATGYTVATTETWKTFCFPSHPRGKFADRPIRFPTMLRRRQRVVPVYVAVWFVVVVALGLSLASHAVATPTQVQVSHE